MARGHYSFFVILLIMTATVTYTVNGSYTYAQSEVPVKDEETHQLLEDANSELEDVNSELDSIDDHADEIETTNKDIEELNKDIKGLLTKLVEKEYKLDPRQEKEVKQQALANATLTHSNVISGYRGYMHNKYLPGRSTGSQAFAEEDPQQFFREVERSEINRFLHEELNMWNSMPLPNSSGNYQGTGQDEAPFTKDLANAVITRYKNGPTPDFKKYTLDNITGGRTETEQFRKGDFSKGGWEAWSAMTEKEGNNPYSAYISATQELTLRKSRAKTAEQKKLAYNNGYHGQETADGRTITPGNINKDRLTRVSNFCERGLEQMDEYDGKEDGEGQPFKKVKKWCNAQQGSFMDPDVGILEGEFADQTFAPAINTGNSNSFEIDQILDDLFSNTDFTGGVSDALGGLFGGILSNIAGPIQNNVDNAIQNVSQNFGISEGTLQNGLDQFASDFQDQIGNLPTGDILNNVAGDIGIDSAALQDTLNEVGPDTFSSLIDDAVDQAAQEVAGATGIDQNTLKDAANQVIEDQVDGDSFDQALQEAADSAGISEDQLEDVINNIREEQ